MMQYPEFLFIVLLSQRIRALEQEPTLECFTDGLRLRFELEKPFYGHIYVKDSFMYENCHLDYTWNPTVGSFYFNVFYKSDCHVKYEREPSGISYQVIIIVQYHYLFLTQAYRAYSVSCFYETVIDPNMQISGLTMTELENEITTNCAYDVLNSINGESIKYANVGDRLIHKWSCESDEYGMLVHSCFVYESDSDTFQLVDNQGCITDHTLMDPLHYSDSLTVAYSVIPAFKFVDKLTIRFQCKVALCIKAQNGCEGISPPKCEYLSTLTSISKHSISKSPSPVLSNILQSSLPRNIESLCEGMAQYKLIIANLVCKKAYQT
uniref:Bm8649 n=1 Tax=Brugia malayi TaxID=6279 RepID=A0A0H5S238_BRUMA|nr:Bm8649 [Brugia malayi]